MQNRALVPAAFRKCALGPPHIPLLKCFIFSLNKLPSIKKENGLPKGPEEKEPSKWLEHTHDK